jgi:hypothetical protein
MHAQTEIAEMSNRKMCGEEAKLFYHPNHFFIPFTGETIGSIKMVKSNIRSSIHSIIRDKNAENPQTTYDNTTKGAIYFRARAEWDVSVQVNWRARAS